MSYVLLDKRREIYPRKNEKIEPKEKKCPVVNVIGDIKSDAVKNSIA